MNVELMERVMRHIEERPERLDMGEWIPVETTCGTVACFAGWAAVLTGCTAVDYEIRRDAGEPSVGMRAPSGEIVNAVAWAQAQLDLTHAEAGRLFFAIGRNVKGLRKLVDTMIEEAS